MKTYTLYVGNSERTVVVATENRGEWTFTTDSEDAVLRDQCKRLTDECQGLTIEGVIYVSDLLTTEH